VDLSSQILPQGALGGVDGHCELGGERDLGWIYVGPDFATVGAGRSWLSL
jgi:hypothetical protein